MTRKKEKRKVNMYFIFLEWWIMCYNRRKKIGMPWKHRLTKRLVENATKIIKSQKTFSLHRPKQTLGIESSGYTHVLIFPLFAPPPPRQKKDTQKDWQNWVASLTKRTCQKADGTTSAALHFLFCHCPIHTRMFTTTSQPMSVLHDNLIKRARSFV